MADGEQMNKPQAFAEARLDHYKSQFGGFRGRYDGCSEVKLKLRRLWDDMTDEEKREAEAAYFETILAYDRSLPR